MTVKGFSRFSIITYFLILISSSDLTNILCSVLKYSVITEPFHIKPKVNKLWSVTYCLVYTKV